MIKYATKLPQSTDDWGITLINNNLIRKKAICHTKDVMEYIEYILKYFIKNRDKLVVPIYNYKIFKHDKIYSYSYDMMRCGILTKSERNFIDSVGALLHSNYDSNENFDSKFIFSNKNIFEKSEQHPELTTFLKTVIDQNLYYDYHSGNIMLNEDGQYVLIDLEGFIRYPIKDNKQIWLTKLKYKPKSKSNLIGKNASLSY